MSPARRKLGPVVQALVWGEEQRALGKELLVTIELVDAEALAKEFAHRADILALIAEWRRMSDAEALTKGSFVAREAVVKALGALLSIHLGEADAEHKVQGCEPCQAAFAAFEHVGVL